MFGSRRRVKLGLHGPSVVILRKSSILQDRVIAATRTQLSPMTQFSAEPLATATSSRAEPSLDPVAADPSATLIDFDSEDDEFLPGDGSHLKEILADILTVADGDALADFAVSGEVKEAPNPSLHIKSLGAIPLPLTSRDAGIIIALCQEFSPLPAGHVETLRDLPGKNIWELNADQFQLRLVRIRKCRWDDH